MRRWGAGKSRLRRENENCGGGKSRMRRENNTILLILLLEEEIKEEKIEEGK